MNLVALVPAAGLSRRMGRPKLTLGLGDESVIQRVVAALERGGASAVLVVAPPVAQVGAIVLANHARSEGAEVVHLEEATPDMRTTIERGLDAMVDHAMVGDGLLLAPGDSPGLTPELVRRVVAEFMAFPDAIVVPVHAGKRGHPVALPWSMLPEIPRLPEGSGVNALLERHTERLRLIEAPDAGAVADLDTPEDYRRWVGR